MNQNSKLHLITMDRLYTELNVTMSFEFPMYDVPESQDTVEVCVVTNAGNSEEFSVNIVSSQSTADNFATG